MTLYERYRAGETLTLDELRTLRRWCIEAAQAVEPFGSRYELVAYDALATKEALTGYIRARRRES